MDHVAVLVGEHLDLDVARVGQVALQVDGRVGEELLALARRTLERVLELVLGQGDAEALAAAAARRLDRHRVADLSSMILRASSTVATGAVVPGTIGTPAAAINSRARVFDPIASIARRGRADEHDPVLLQGRGEPRVLGQEAVAGMDRLRARALDDLEQLLDRSDSSRPPGRARAGTPRRPA